jgi:hypothetical protein
MQTRSTTAVLAVLIAATPALAQEELAQTTAAPTTCAAEPLSAKAAALFLELHDIDQLRTGSFAAIPARPHGH